MIEKRMHATIAQPNQLFSKSKKVGNDEQDKFSHTTGDIRPSNTSNNWSSTNGARHEVSSLHLLAIEGDKPSLQSCLNTGKFDINEGDHMGRTPLIYSILGDQVECAMFLLKAGAEIDKVDIDERTALHWAAYQGNHKIVKLLINKGANLTAKDAENRTPLHLATTHDNIKVFQALLKHSNPSQIDVADGNGMTSLCWCVFYNRIEFTKLLLKYGASPHRIDDEHRSILHWTSKHEQPIILKLLIQHGYKNLNWPDNKQRTLLHLAVAELNLPLVDYLLKLPGLDVNIQDQMDRTPLHWAAILKGRDLVALLLQHEADFSIGDKRGIRALHYAVQSGDVETLQAMLNTCPGKIKDIPDNSKGTALMWAAVKGNVEIIGLLLEHKCSDVLAVDEHKQSALHLCIQSGEINAVKTLIQFGADVKQKDEKQHIPLFYACASGNSDIVKELVKYSSPADLADKDEDGRCTLHYAAMVDCPENIKILLDNDIDPNLTDSAGRPPLHFAAYCGLVHCMNALLEKGAQVDFEDDGKQTALHWACRSGSLGAVKLLVSRFNAKVNVLNSSDVRLTPLDYAIVGDHQDVALYLTEHNAFTGMYLRETAAPRIQAVCRGYLFRKYNKNLINRIKSSALQQKSINQRPQIIPITPSEPAQNTTNNVTSNKGAITRESWKTYGYLSESIEKEGSALESLLKTIQNTSKIPTEPAVSPIVGRRKSSASILSGNTFSPKSSSIFLSPASAGKEMRGGSPKFPDLTNPSKSTSSNDKFFSNRKLFFDNSNSELINSNNNKKLKQNEWTTWKEFDRNMHGIPPASSRNSSASLSPRSSQVKDTNKRESFPNAFSRHNINNKRKETSSSTPSSSGIISLLNGKYSSPTMVDVSLRKYTPSLMTSLSSNDITSLISSNDADKPWNIYRRDQKRIVLIRKKTDAAVKIQRAFRRYLRRKQFKPKRKLSRQDRLSDTENTHSINVNVKGIDKVSDNASLESVATVSDEIPDEDTLNEVAALVIQLAYRGYLKRKLVENMTQKTEKARNDISDTAVETELYQDFSEKHNIQPKKTNKKTKVKQIDVKKSQESENTELANKRKALSPATSFPLMQNVYRQSLRKKRSKKFSIKKKLFNLTSASNSVAISDDTAHARTDQDSQGIHSRSLRPTLSNIDVNELKNGKPKLFLSRRQSLDVFSTSSSSKK